jgi:hypothetical protein
LRQVRDRRSSWKPPTQHNVPKWLESRDCDPFTGKVLESRLVDDPSAPGGKRGMRFADFMLHPIVLLCQLTEAEVSLYASIQLPVSRASIGKKFSKFNVASFMY